MIRKQSLVPILVSASYFLAPTANQPTEEVVSFTPDQGIYLATAHVSQSFLLSGGEIVVRCQVMMVKDGVVIMSLFVTNNTYKKLVPDSEIQKKAKESWGDTLEKLVEASVQNAGLQEYYKGTIFYK